MFTPTVHALLKTNGMVKARLAYQNGTFIYIPTKIKAACLREETWQPVTGSRLVAIKHTLERNV
jgi:hypothetical protein